MNVPSDNPYNAKIAQEKAEWDEKQRVKKEKKEKSQYVILNGIDIPFIDLVVFSIKLAIAAFPAIGIAIAFWCIFWALFFRAV